MSTESTGRFGPDYFRTLYGTADCRPLSQAWWSVRLYAGIARGLLRRSGGRRVLEVGCGFGFLLARLENRCETLGVDVSPHAVERCAQVSPRSRCLVGDVERALPAELARGSIDLVIARYVLEHLREPAAALREIAALLRPGGFLLAAVPNTESLGARWKGRDWYALQDPTHCALLSPAQWRALARDAGLLIRRETADGYWDLSYVRWLPRWVQAPVFLAPAAVACLLARPVLPAGWGENLILIAQKPEVRPDG